jgi:hypothetical protein
MKQRLQPRPRLPPKRSHPIALSLHYVFLFECNCQLLHHFSVRRCCVSQVSRNSGSATRTSSPFNVSHLNEPCRRRVAPLYNLGRRDVTTYLVTNQITPFFCFKSSQWIVTPSIHKPGKRCDNTIKAISGRPTVRCGPPARARPKARPLSARPRDSALSLSSSSFSSFTLAGSNRPQ